MTYEIITQEDLQKFRLQLLEDLTRMMSGAVQPQLNKEWMRSSEVRKMLGISHGTLQNLRIKDILPHRKVGGLMYYKYQDILRRLEGRETSAPGPSITLSNFPSSSGAHSVTLAILDQCDRQSPISSRNFLRRLLYIGPLCICSARANSMRCFNLMLESDMRKGRFRISCALGFPIAAIS